MDDGGADFQQFRYATAVAARLLHPVASAAALRRCEDLRDTFHEACASEELLDTFGAKLGDWLLLGSQCWVRLVDSNEVSALAPPPWRKELPLIHLPAGVLELLGATPGRTEVSVAWQPGLQPAMGRRLVLSADGQGSDVDMALKSYFHVPRVLRCGEVISLPRQGLPGQLRSIESLSAEGRILPDFAKVSGEVYEVAPHLGAQDSRTQDPLHGYTFAQLFSFQVEVLEGLEKNQETQSYKVDSNTIIIVEGSCQARGVPYARSHLFCEAPPPILPSLRPCVERLLGIFAPLVHTWQLQGSSPSPSVLTVGPRGCGKRLLWRIVCERLGLRLVEFNCSQLEHPEAQLPKLCQQAARQSPCVLCLRRLHSLTKAQSSPHATLLLQRRIEEALQAALEGLRGGLERPLVILAGSCEDLDVGGPLRQAFRLEMELPRPTEAHRQFAIARLMGKKLQKPVANGLEVDQEAAPPLLETMAKMTAGLSYSDLRSVCAEVLMSQPSASLQDTASPEVQKVIEVAVKRLQGGSKVAVTLASKVQWADVGGLQDAKDEIINCITLPLSQGDPFSNQKLRSGVLLFGPPGTGKTLLAKAVATECKVHFLSVKGPELLSMYIGESEKNVRSLFQSARDLAPCVLFFDELDALAPARGRGSDSGGVMDRVVSQLVTELDTMPATVFMVGATNRPDLLDRSLLRPGRLDRMVYLGVAKDKLPLLRAVSRKFVLDDASALDAVAAACPANLTGADVSVLCADAYATAQREHIGKLHELADGLQVQISTLLLFLDAWELHLPKPRSFEQLWAGRSGLSRVFPPSDVKVNGGIMLYGVPREASVVLAHHTGTSEGFRDVCAAVAIMGEGSTAEISQSWAAASELPLKMLHGLDILDALQVHVAKRHFTQALSNLQPSVPMEDLQRYEQLRGEYQNTKG